MRPVDVLLDWYHRPTEICYAKLDHLCLNATLTCLVQFYLTLRTPSLCWCDNVFCRMSRLREPPPKFLPREWKHANDVHYGNAESERIRSELLTADSQRLMEQCDRATKRMQEQASKRLGKQLLFLPLTHQAFPPLTEMIYCY